jgi:hypothetical protein
MGWMILRTTPSKLMTSDTIRMLQFGIYQRRFGEFKVNT